SRAGRAVVRGEFGYRIGQRLRHGERLVAGHLVTRGRRRDDHPLTDVGRAWRCRAGGEQKQAAQRACSAAGGLRAAGRHVWKAACATQVADRRQACPPSAAPSCSGGSSANVTGTRTRPGTALPFSIAGVNFHCRAASTVPASNTPAGVARSTSTSVTLPSAATLTIRMTCPVTPDCAASTG